jgi:6-phosphogluconolactonase
MLVAGIEYGVLAMIPRIHILTTKERLYEEAADTIARLIDETLRSRGSCTFVLAGGSTPEGLYKRLASPPFDTEIDWGRVHFFWGDERAVPPDHTDSNYRMAHNAFLSKLPVSGSNIHRIPAEHPPAEAALLYEVDIRKFFGSASLPSFNIVLLGLGEDGHTASIFPGTSAITETDRIVTDVYVGQLRSHRITLSLPAINNARCVIFLVSGKSKAPVVREVIVNKNPNFPATAVQPLGGKLLWMIDADAWEHIDSPK